MKVVFCSLLAVALAAPMASAKVTASDICIYGATSGGVIAAVEAARMGKTVSLLEPGNHVGGMTSSGLGWVDFGRKNAIGGAAREFFERVAAHYPGAKGSEAAQGPGWTFEPHVAEDIFRQMLSEARVKTQFGRQLAGVNKEGTRIVSLVMTDGDVFRAKIFIDASYEGDMMAGAKVGYAIGREFSRQYNEPLNGIHVNRPAIGGKSLRIDPFLIPGDRSSGLIPLVQTASLGAEGDASPIVQSYNYRLCLTRKAANRMRIDPPPNYDPREYELLARFIAARVAADPQFNLKDMLKIDPMPNGKTDVNNNGFVSTDYIGYAAEYPEADYKKRQLIAKDHENYTRGLLCFLATDQRVPANIRKDMNEWGLCRDEFRDTGGWPFQLYVREARRMIGSYVMTQHDCENKTVIPDSVGLASYMLDSHCCQRLVQDGRVVDEGGTGFRISRAYPISYRCLVPKIDECQNLLVPVCCSASHVAYCSIRMEPVFMILGQSSGAAAVLAIDAKVPVQQVPYEALAGQLRRDHQVLGPEIEASASVSR